METSMEIRRSYAGASSECVVGASNGKPIRYGDKIFVRLTDMYGYSSMNIEFTTCSVTNMSDIYGELRRRTREIQGLKKLYVRNVSRGWSFVQPFKIYSSSCRPAQSVARPVSQLLRKSYNQDKPVNGSASSIKHEVPESVRLLFSA